MGSSYDNSFYIISILRFDNVLITKLCMAKSFDFGEAVVLAHRKNYKAAKRFQIFVTL